MPHPPKRQPHSGENENIPIRVIRNPSQRIVPSRKRRQQAKETSSLDNRRVGHAGGIAMQVADAEEQEGEVKGEEKEEEGDGGAESGE